MQHGRRHILAVSVIAMAAGNGVADLLWYSEMDGNANATGGYGSSPAAIIGSPTATSNRFGEANSAVYFDGNDRYDLTRETEFFQSATLSLRVVLSDTNNTEIGPIAVGGSGGGNIEYFTIMRQDGDETRGYLRTDCDNGIDRMYREAPSALPVGEWHHLAATFKINQLTEQTTITFYFDGTGVTSTYPASGAIVPSYDWMVGSERVGGYRWIGAIDEVAIWNMALTAEQIGLLADGSRLPPEILGPRIMGPTLIIIR